MIARPPVRITAPATLPVTLAEAKQHLRVDHADDDGMITRNIQAAVDDLDGHGGILGGVCLINQQWRQDFDGFCRFLRLPFPNVSAVSVKYDDADGVEQTVAPAEYRVLTDAIGPYLASVPSSYWPSATGAASVRVTFTAGYGASGDDVPSSIKDAILIAVELTYDRPSGDEYRALKDAYDRSVGKNRRQIL